MPIIPDTKNWAWAVERSCPECGFDPDAHPTSLASSTIRSNAAAWRPRLERDDASVRPRDDRWAPVEYACHVRDVYRVFLGRLGLMLREDSPSFQSWDQDETAVVERYDLQDPATVADEVLAAGTRLADAFDEVRADEWQRTGTRSDGTSYTVASLATLAQHDPIHHLWDVAY